MKHLLNLSFKEVETFLKGLGEKPFRVKQLLKWVYHKRTDDFEMMTDLSSDLRSKLKEHLFINSLKVASVECSSDGTERFNLMTNDGHIFPCVWLPSKSRRVICLSTQIGCPVGCRFCASGSDFKRNLTAGEIVEQVLVVSRAKKQLPDGVLLMGMGEPLLNYDGVVRALQNINSPVGLNIGSRHITLSTVGVVPRIKKLSGEKLKIRLAVSLHAPDDSLRKNLIPNCKGFIDDILSSAFDYAFTTKTRLTIEYLLLKNITDDLDCAKKLTHLIKKHQKSEKLPQLQINLIPYNHIPDKNFQPPTKDWQQKFKEYLVSNGFFTTIRENKGQDIKSACGQLGF